MRTAALSLAFQPAVRIELGRMTEVCLIDRDTPHERHNHRALGNSVTQHLDVFEGFHGSDRRDRLQAHGFVVERFDERQLSGLLDFQRQACRAEHGIDFSAGAREIRRVFDEIIDRPGDGVGGGVLAGQQQRADVAEDIGIGEFHAFGPLRGDDGFEKIGWLLIQRGIGLHALAHIGDHRINLDLDIDQGAIQLAILRQLEIPPVGEGRVDAPIQHRKYLVELLLDDRTIGLDGVDVDAESKLSGDIDREAHQIATQINHAALRSRALPARQQALGSDLKLGEKRFQVRGIERHRYHFALPTPLVTLRRKHARQTHLVDGVGQTSRAAELIRTFTVHALDGVRVTAHHDTARTDTKAIKRTVFVSPVFKNFMEGFEIEFKQIAEQRQARRAGQRFDSLQLRAHCDHAVLPLEPPAGRQAAHVYSVGYPSARPPKYLSERPLRHLPGKSVPRARLAPRSVAQSPPLARARAPQSFPKRYNSNAWRAPANDDTDRWSSRAPHVRATWAAAARPAAQCS